jgi:hypothetical protein
VVADRASGWPCDAGPTRGSSSAAAEVEREPDHSGRQQPRIGAEQQDRRADQIGQREGDRVEDLEHRLARAGGVCMIRLAMRPAKSFSNQPTDWRSTCRCARQRISVPKLRQDRVVQQAPRPAPDMTMVAAKSFLNGCE